MKARQSSVFVEYDQGRLLSASTALVLLLCIIRLPQHLGRDCATVGKETCNQIRDNVGDCLIVKEPNPISLKFCGTREGESNGSFQHLVHHSSIKKHLSAGLKK